MLASGSEMDTAIAKVSALPMFDYDFRRLIILMNMCTVERIVAFPAKDHMQFAGMMQDVAPYVLPKAAGALGPSADLLQLVADKAEMFHALWIMVMAAKPTFLRNAALSLGFGVLDFTVKRSLDPPLSVTDMC
jgi:hypothetical protein